MGCDFSKSKDKKEKQRFDIFLKIKNLNKEEGKEFYEHIPFDEYLCPKCGTIPEILKVHSDYDRIEIKCKIHGTQIIEYKEYYDEIVNSKEQYYNKSKNFTCPKCGEKYKEKNEEKNEENYGDKNGDKNGEKNDENNGEKNDENNGKVNEKDIIQTI